MTDLVAALDPAEVAAEHEELLAPIISGDTELAEKLFRVHLVEGAANLVELYNSRATDDSDTN